MVTRLAAWREFPQLSASTLSVLFGMEFANIEESSDFSPTAAAGVRLNATGDLEEVPVVVEMDQSGLAALGQLMFGEESDTAMQMDMLLEIANTMAGAFSREALAEQRELTIGLPASVPTGQAKEMVTTGAHRTVVVQNAELGARVRVTIGKRSKHNVKLPVAKVREGMVLAADVVSAEGAVLMKAGTRFSEVQAERLGEALPPTDLVEVADTAA